MHTIEDLMRILGFNENQVRVRLREFKSYLEIRNGKNNKLLITSSGLKVLERIKELETGGFTLDSIKAVLDKELPSGKDPLANGESSHVQTDASEIQSVYKERIQDLKVQIEYLQSQLKEKDGQIAELYGIVKDRLPALTGDVERPHPGIWGRFRRLVRGA